MARTGKVCAGRRVRYGLPPREDPYGPNRRGTTMGSINTNISALVAARVFETHNRTMAQTLERLSTGFRINSGRDDPAGIIASETLRSEIKAIGAAIENARVADSFVAVAEGALNEVNALLLELESLIDRSANEAALSNEEIAANQLQIDAILDSINRIATSTEYKGKKLLNGSFDFTTQSVNSALITSVRIHSARVPNNATRNVVVQVAGSAQTGELRFTNGTAAITSAVTIRVAGNLGVDTFSFAANQSLSSIASAVNQSKNLTGVSATVSGTVLRFNSTDYGSKQFVAVEAVNGNFATTDAEGNSATKDFGQDVTAIVNGVTANSDGLKVQLRSNALDLELILDPDLGTLATASTTTFEIEPGGANFVISPTISLAGTINIGFAAMDDSSLGNQAVGFLSSLRSGQANDLVSKNYSTAQKIIREAISEVSSLRGRIGAFQQNTLNSTVNALQIALENATAAESAIRDADFAAETSRLTRTQILLNATSSVMQIANALPQNFLALLA